jgi:amino acid adenylation domain-containing protein
VFFTYYWPVFSVVLSKFYFTNEINIGTPVINRVSRSDRLIFGPFINLLPLQIIQNSENSFLELIRQIKSEVFKIFRHQKFQQAEIIKTLDYKGNRLYDFRISYENFNYENTFSNYKSYIVALSNNSEEDPLSVHIMDYDNEGLKFRFDINGSYIPEYIANEFIESLTYIFENTKDILYEKIKTLSVTTPEQKEIVKSISEGNLRETDTENFIDVWNFKVKSSASNEAFIFKNEKLTYAEADKLVKTISTFLKQKGINKGDRVGILLDKSINLIPVILGVMQSGATYVPIDKSFPERRKEFIIRDSNLRLILTDEDAIEYACKTFLLKTILKAEIIPETDPVSILPQDEAYIIYTSGSTGKPKGVPITHESLIDYTITFTDYFNLNESDCVIQQSSLVFDTSIEEIFPVLSVGGTLLISENPKDFHNVLQECSKNGVTLLSTNPFVIQYLNDHYHKYTFSFKVIISGGDVIGIKQVKNLLEKANIYNTYGPTESTVCATYHKITAEDDHIPIGKPITNRKVFVVNGNDLLPKGAIGEITLAGKGLTSGYLNNETLTKSLFSNFEDERIYRTGDLGQWDSQGNLLFCGRKDNQLSFRGYRIEPQEIEIAIKSIEPEVNNCFVTIKEIQNAPALIAYISAASNHFDTISLLRALERKLPNFMIPNYVVQLDSFPLNTSGKIDTKRLPLPEIQNVKKEIVLPSTETEMEIAIIWKKLLNVEDVDIDTNFFNLGGHSLLANRFIGLIRDQRKQDITLKEFYKAPTVREIAKALDGKTISTKFELKKAPNQELYPLSFPQERLWFLNQLNQKNKSYYVPRAIKMTGVLDVSIIEKTFTLLIEKHEILRTLFPVFDGIPYQKIIAPYYFKIPVISLTGLSKEEQDKALEDFILKEGNLQFDLDKGPLLRVTILKRSETDNVLVLCEHHLIHDGWTQGILLREFINTYSELRKDANYSLQEPEFQFKDFSYWQKAFFTDETLGAHIKFWKTKLEGHIPVLPLPQKNKRPKEISGNGELLIKTIDETLSDKIRDFSLANKITLFITMLAAFKVTLSRFSNETDICIGTAVANRRLASINDMLGMVINTIALRTQFNNSDSLKLILDKVKETCFEAYTFEDTPFGKVVEHVAPARSLGLMPIFQYMFSFMNTPSRNLFLPDLELEILDSHNLTAKFDINVVVVTPFEQALLEGTEETNRTIIVEWEYYSDIYSKHTMLHMLESYFDILEAMVSAPYISYKEVPCVTPEQQKQLVETFNNTKTNYPESKTVVDLFREQVIKNPDAIAIVFEEIELTYRELEDLSNRLANYILNKNKVEKDSIVGIQLKRSQWTVISMLAVLKAGAAYVSIDSDFPEKRIDFIKQDSECKIIIDKAFINRFKAGDQHSVSPDIQVTPEHLAYIIYTSGSTGLPKGVMLEHKNLVNFLFDYQLDTHNTSLTCKTIFDVSVFEIMGSITSGSTLFIPDEEVVYNPEEYADFLYQNKISHCYLHPMHLEEIANKLKSYQHIYLKKILIGVEGIKPAAVKWYYDNEIEIVNAYGPTECTICATKYKVDNLSAITTVNIPIGTPLNNYQAYILDEHSHNLQPKGVIGELCISGKGIARGYLNQPELTKEKFINHPFKKGERLYKTGDLARWLPDGNIEFIGRKDHQVKIRGHRIELGEIEYALNNQNPIKQSVVILLEKNNEKFLIGYYVSEKELEAEALKQSLLAYLPGYMIPNYLKCIESIPLTPNGKIDRKLLPDINIDELGRKKYVAPRNELEQKLAAIWEEVLGIDKIGITDNFFELGGHSLKATQLINKINKELSSAVEVKEVFTHPTIASLSKKIHITETILIPSNETREYYPLSSSQRRLWVLSQFEGGNKAYSIPGVFKMNGALDVKALSNVFCYLIERHESLRTQFVELQDDVYQQIVKEETIKFTMDKLDVSEETVNNEITAFYQEEFNLNRAPLLKARILQIHTSQCYLLFAIHHIIGDGWSMEVFTKELIYAYNQLVSGKNIELPELGIQYKDYVLWNLSQERQENLLKQGTYWKNKLSGELPVLDLPTYKKRPMVKTFSGTTKLFSFSKEWSNRLNVFCKNRNVTLYMSLLAGINGLFHRYTGATDIILGAPIAGRSNSELEHQIGLYLNTLAIRTTFNRENSFTDLLKEQKKTLLEAYENQEYPFDSLVEELELKRDTSRSALFDVLVVLQNQKETSIALEGLKITPYQQVSTGVSQFDMTFSFSEDHEGIHLRIEYNDDIYEKTQIDYLCVHLERFIEAAIAAPDQSISNLPYLTNEERTQLVETFNNTKTNYPESKTVVDLFREQVIKNPNAIAIVFEEIELTYRELEDLSNRLANYILNKNKVEKDSIVGIQLKRSQWTVISMLAVLKAGAAYVSIDSDFPEKRIDFIKQDSECKIIIDKAFINRFKAGDQHSVSPDIQVTPEHLAYIIYTSGSTGLPKGVMLEHKNLVNFLFDYQLDTHNTSLTCKTIFDVSVFEIMGSITSGSTLFIPDEEVVYNPEEYADFLYQNKISHCYLHPMHLEEIANKLKSYQHIYLKKILIGVEGIKPAAVKWYYDNEIEIVNAYGPTECTICATKYKVDNLSAITTVNIPIGTPLNNYQAYILDEHSHNLQPKGVIGELCISGKGIARGYLNQPELTKEKFINHPFKKGERLYKTGDLARWLPDGNIEFIGRKDHQVKIRGHRIELGEIEYALNNQNPIKQSVVILLEKNNEKFLIGYYVSEKELEAEALKQSLLAYLPGYMIPNYLKCIESIPLTPNGKIDRKLLPDINIDELGRKKYVAPRNELEQKLAAIWEEVLGIDKIGITDNFFSIGGNSIKAVTIRNRIKNYFEVNIQIDTFFNEPTIQNIAEIISVLSSQTNYDSDSQEDIEELII